MPVYNFKKETKLYLVYNNLKYAIDLYPDLTFSQTFNEMSVPVKTLHTPYDMFENAVITRANAANFNFSIPILLERDMDILLYLLTEYAAGNAVLNSADLYIQSNSETYKLERAVFESGVFQISKTAFLGLTLSRSASKLSPYLGTIPGVLLTRSANQSFSQVDRMSVLVNGFEKTGITSVSLELRNNVKWLDNATLQNSTKVTSASGTMFPEAFVVSSRQLIGTIQQYITDEDKANVNSWSTNTSLTIQVGGGSGMWALEFAIPSVVYTNRLEVQEIFIQSYDFRMNVSPISMSSIIKKRSI